MLGNALLAKLLFQHLNLQPCVCQLFLPRLKLLFQLCGDSIGHEGIQSEYGWAQKACSRCLLNNRQRGTERAKSSVFMRFSVTLLVLLQKPCDATYVTASESNQCPPTATPALRDSTRFSSHRCLSRANEISHRLIFSHTPKARSRHIPAASAGCAAHWRTEIHGRSPGLAAINSAGHTRPLKFLRVSKRPRAT